MHESYMRRAIQLAALGEGFVNPNPLVGAVIVKDGRIIGEGWHERYGENHAERNAFKHASSDTAGADMYVSLEPCSHHGKTPPCVDAIIEKGIKRVFVSMTDPNPLVSGRGIKQLRSSGIQVVTGILEEESQRLNEVFIKYISTGLPFCLMKWAMTLDGKIAAHTGDSRWVSGPEARQHVHRLRHKITAIMVGIGTVLADDPALTTRLSGVDFTPKNPVKVILDTHLQIPLSSKVLDGGTTFIACGLEASQEKETQLQNLGAKVLRLPISEGSVDVKALMKALGEEGIDSVLLEGGGRLNFSALKSGIVDKAEIFIAPKIIGGKEAKTPVEGPGFAQMAQSLPFSITNTKQIGSDILLECYPQRKRK